MSYKLKLEMFEGPLDLLLYLIKKDEIDIKDIPIASVTDQYMQYIEMMKMLDLEIVGEFLVMAATLLQIKSRMLLPPDPNLVAEEEEDPRDELIRRLEEYKKFKEAAGDLREKEVSRQNLFARRMDETQLNELKADAREVYYEVSLFDLISALSKALQRVPTETVYSVEREEYTVEEKIHDMLHLMTRRKQVRLSDLFAKARSKAEVIVTFIAMLELIRLKEIIAVQSELFGEIEVQKNMDNIAVQTPLQPITALEEPGSQSNE